jgi:hypothetical protein
VAAADMAGPGQVVARRAVPRSALAGAAASTPANFKAAGAS